jgi:predicted O-methyltransferase YrrM
MSLANPKARIITAEGSTAIAAQAKRNFQSLQLSSIQQVTGNFDDTLPGILSSLSQLDLVFIDGNHRYEPTMRYFNQLLPHMNANGIMIFDDIHWSQEMEQAWNEVRENAAVQLSVDLFFIGLVFFNDDFKIKQHFTIRF